MAELLRLLEWVNPVTSIEKIRKYWRRPKLRIYFDRDETYLTRNVVDMGNVPGFFCHLVVTNNGRGESARNCRGRLMQISIANANGDFQRDRDFGNPVVLKWAHESDYDPRDIEKDVPKRLDLCFAVQDRPNELIFFTPQLPNGNRTTYSKGKYIVKVRVDADNTSPVEGNFCIEFNGTWNDIQLSAA